jgi:DNA-binding SARP family transcriptional activator
MRLLGPFQVNLDKKPATGFKYNHVRALLAYLAVEADRPHRRERLAGLLWPGQPHSRALSNLRYALYHLRQAIADHDAEPSFLLISRQTLQFNTASHHWLDVSAFQRHIADSRSTDQPPTASSQGTWIPQTNWGAQERSSDVGPYLARDGIGHLQAAVDLYRGSFLEGFSLANSPPFEAWLLLKQEQLAQQLLSTLHSLIRRLASQGDYQQAEPYARRLLAL